MARRTKQTAELVAQDVATITVSTMQLARYQGRYLASVEVQEDGILVWCKRARGGRYDRHFTPWKNVISYCEGTGGRREPTHAVVRERVILFQQTGTIERDVDTGITLTTDDGGTHVLPPCTDPGIEMKVTYPAGKPAGQQDDIEDGAPVRAGRRSRKRTEPAEIIDPDDVEDAEALAEDDADAEDGEVYDEDAEDAGADPDADASDDEAFEEVPQQPTRRTRTAKPAPEPEAPRRGRRQEPEPVQPTKRRREPEQQQVHTGRRGAPVTLVKTRAEQLAAPQASTRRGKVSRDDWSD